jgi:hypothetical protein
MKPINLVKSFTFISLLSVCLSFQGCIEDDLSVCGANLRFAYTQNVEGVDKFDASIKQVNLFVFDSSDRFIGEYKVENVNNIDLNLMPGTYSLIAWGNLDEDYSLTPMVVGETTLNEAVLSLIRANDTISVSPTDLYYGGMVNVDILPKTQRDQSLTIDMMKNTKTFTVTSIGLPIDTRSSEDEFVCQIISTNGDYNFRDNSIAGDDRLHYMQDSEITEDALLRSRFVTLRELEDKSTDSRLVVTHWEAELNSTREVYNESLVDLILPAVIANNRNLNVVDTFNIQLDFTGGRIAVTVNGWTSIDTDRPI